MAKVQYDPGILDQKISRCGIRVHTVWKIIIDLLLGVIWNFTYKEVNKIIKTWNIHKVLGNDEETL